ncbi:Protein Y73F8A.35 a [Aphelenchoides avenae]|nr:Protein Y73F8A.35 a [Aphelenchus avenae]
MSLLDTDYNPMRNCTSTFKAYTRLVNGSVLVDRAALADGSHCKFRCLYPVDDYNYRESSWKNPESEKPDCDVVETNCWNENDTTPFHKDIHLQIYQKKDVSPKLPPTAPSVYWLVIDGVSTPQLIRSLPKTMHLLREDYDAIIFHHLNKIALNTPPNSRAMLLGKQMYDVIRFDPHDPTYKADLEPDFCHMDMIDSQFIGNLYRNAGYRTMIAEDWAQYAFNFLNCTGFKSSPADHYIKPFNLWLRGKEGFGRIALDSDFMRKRCKEVHEYVMDYFERFISAYPDEPKFSYVWLTEIAHTNPSCLFHLDDFTYEFFLRNRDKLKNSFFLIGGDHGHRNYFRETDIGNAEDRTPSLLIATPEVWRKEHADLDGQLRANAKQLVTHYDTYATLADILRHSVPDTVPEPTILGTSLLRQLPQPRNCDALRIPFEFCHCEMHWEPVEITGAHWKMTEFLVGEVNDILRYNNVSDICETLILDTDKIIVVKRLKNAKNTYTIKFHTQPNNGTMVGNMRVLDDASFYRLSRTIERLDNYHDQSHCIKVPSANVDSRSFYLS